MSTNFGQYSYPQYPQQGNFNGNPAMLPVADKAIENAQSTGAGQVLSDFPTTPDQFIKESPYIAAAAGVGFASKWLLGVACGKNTTYEQSPMRKFTAWIDQKVPFLQTIDEKVLNKIAEPLARLTGKIKYDAAEPSLSMAKGFFKGAKGNSVEALVEGLRKLEPDVLKNAGIEKILNNKTLSHEAIYQEIKKLGGIEKIPAEKLIFSAPREKMFGFIPMPTKNHNLNLNYNTIRQFEGEGAKSYFTRFLPKMKIFMGETLTGGVIGGPFGIILNAVFLGHSIKRAVEAPKGEKLSTFMEDFWGYQFANMVLMPIMGKFMYDKVIGLKYLGANKEAIKSSIESLNGRVFANKKLDKLGEGAVDDKLREKIAKKLKVEVKDIKGNNAKEILEHLGATKDKIATGVDELKTLKKGNLTFLKNPVKRTLKLAGDLLGVGLDKIPGKFGNKLKGFGGGALRFGILMFGVMPVVTNLFMKASHAVFGKPTNSLMDQDKKAEENKEGNKDVNKQQSPFTNTQNQDLYKFINKPQQPQQNQTSSNQQPVRTYIPQPTPVTINNSEPTVDKTLEKSDRIMEHANEVLKNLNGSN